MKEHESVFAPQCFIMKLFSIVSSYITGTKKYIV